MMKNNINRALLLILDGFGKSPNTIGNAIAQANTPNIDKFMAENPQAELHTSGLEVGLPEGIMGNSEVGHLNIGAGRIVYQLNTMISKDILDGTFGQNKAFQSAFSHVKESGSKLHLFGLLSDGNVHSNEKHLWELLKEAKKAGIKEVYYHAFMDGRDTLPTSGIKFIQEFLDKATEIGIGKIATVNGRYYAMDRDNRWDRVEKAYRAIAVGNGNFAVDSIEAIEASYANKVEDEFIIPTVLQENGQPIAKVEDNDAVIFFNFRADRAREITRAFMQPDFTHFEVKKYSNLKFVTLSQYDINFTDWVEVAFKMPSMDNILGEVIANNNLKQVRLAETEKYAHVTFFFNGGKEDPFTGEERILVPSPSVATYDLQPEMSAPEVTEKLLEALKNPEYSLIITNFANCDMVGHTGFIDATIKAVETVDASVGKIAKVAKENGVSILLTADHGNAETMLDKDGNIMTSHSTNPVPIVIASPNVKSLKSGVLADIAPTILTMMNLEIPKEMTGQILIEKV